MADMSSDQKDEFKLSFKPSSINMSGHNGSHQQWMASSTNNFATQFNQSPSSILLSGFNENNNNNNNTNNSNLSIFNSINNNNNTLNTNNNILNASLSHLATDSEIIFNESVPIIVKTSKTETNTRNLTLKIEKVVQLPQNQSILSITLTDESDPYFLYTLNVTENDFHHLKSDQKLLVDFAVFPKSLIMLLKQCLQYKNKEHPKFVAVLQYLANNNNTNYAVLSVQETNQFRQLFHISLKLISANNDRLRKYLGQTLMIYKSQNRKLNKSYCDTKQSLQRSKLDKKQAENYITEIKQKYEQCLCDLKTSHSQQISLIKQNNLDTIEEIRKELQNKKNDLESELKLQIKNNMLKYNKLKDEFDELNTKYLTVNNQYKNQSEILKTTKQSFELNKTDLSELRIECKNLDELKFKYEKQINEYQINMAAFKQQIKDKSEINENNTSLLHSEREQKKSIEQQIKLYKTNLEKSEKKVKECIKEINKGNNIISHLQNEIRNQRNKNKLKEQKLLNVEQKYQNNNNNISQLNEDMNKKDDMINKYKNEIKELKNTLRQCKDKLQQSQKAIESNQRVISYLNKQLNDNQMNNNIFASNTGNSHTLANNNHLLAGMTPSPFNTNINHNHNQNMTSNYQSPYLNHKMSGLNNIGNIGANATAVSPILNQNNSNHSKASPSSYFPQ